MNRRFKLFLGLLVALAPAGAAQATVVFGLTGNSTLDGTQGNSRLFTGSDGTTRVRASAWSITLNSNGTLNRVYDSYLGAFGNGLGVTSSDEIGGGSNTHTIDNQNRRDFILLQFNRPVEFMSAVFTTYSVNGQTRDSDATIGWNDTNLNWMSQPALDGANFSALSGLFANTLSSTGAGSGLYAGSLRSAGTGTSGLRNLSATGVGDLWLVGADFYTRDTGSVDGFKFSALTVALPVPEPATWLMMIMGFGAAGFAIRRRRAIENATPFAA